MNEQVTIQRLGEDDVVIFQKVIRLFHKVFETETIAEASKSYLISLLKKPDFIAYSVTIDDEIVGGLTAYELPMYYSNRSEVFVYDIAVLPEFQRVGLGKKLILSLQEYCKQNNLKGMFVAANEEDEQAVNFYHSTGGKAEKVIHFNYFI